MYGRYAAVLWSSEVSGASPSEVQTVVDDQLTTFRLRFGQGVVGLDSNQFRSLRDGTVAVAYDGGFASAAEAKRWCRERGFPGLYDCFGVVLSDDFGPDDRGDHVRVYDL